MLKKTEGRKKKKTHRKRIAQSFEEKPKVKVDKEY